MIPNPDKHFHEEWHSRRNIVNFPHPFRAVCLGPPNVGKTLAIKTMILHQYPHFKKIFVIHCDSAYTKEYDDVEVEYLDVIPQPEEWEGDVKTLVVLDDLEVKMLPKKEKRALDRLFGFVSTHKNVSVILASQDTFNVPPIVRRCANVWIMWRSPDLDALAMCARKAGFKSDDLKILFDELMELETDSLCIDRTSKSPYPLRKNLFEPIEREEVLFE
jgi:hypothetical protein